MAAIKETQVLFMGKWDLAERKLVEFFRKNGIPAVKIETFDILIRVLNQTYAVEVKRNDREEWWRLDLHRQTWINQMKLAKAFKWKRIIILTTKHGGDWVIEKLAWIDKAMEKKMKSKKTTLRLKRHKREKFPLIQWLEKVNK